MSILSVSGCTPGNRRLQGRGAGWGTMVVESGFLRYAAHKSVIGFGRNDGSSFGWKRADGTGYSNGKGLRGWRTAYTPTHRNVRDGCGTRAFLAGGEQAKAKVQERRGWERVVVEKQISPLRCSRFHREQLRSK